MAHGRSAKKRIRQNLKRREGNRRVRSALRTQLRKVVKLCHENKLPEARRELVRAYILLDKAAQGKIVHPNLAARQKSRLAGHVNRLAGSTAAAGGAS